MKWLCGAIVYGALLGAALYVNARFWRRLNRMEEELWKE